MESEEAGSGSTSGCGGLEFGQESLVDFLVRVARKIPRDFLFAVLFQFTVR